MVRRTLSLLFAGIYILVALTSPLVILSMHHEHGSHAHCPFQLDGETGLCSMTTLEHLSHFQNAFAGLVPHLLFLAVLSVLIVVFPWQVFSPPRVPRRHVAFQNLFVPQYVLVLVGTSLFTRAP
jgi:hypothetical protein